MLRGAADHDREVGWFAKALVRRHDTVLGTHTVSTASGGEARCSKVGEKRSMLVSNSGIWGRSLEMPTQVSTTMRRAPSSMTKCESSSARIRAIVKQARLERSPKST